MQHKLTFISQVARLDALIDQLELSTSASIPSSPKLEELDQEPEAELDIGRFLGLQGLIKSFSATPSTKISTWRLQRSLESTVEAFDDQPGLLHASENELRWLAISKAAIQVYGLVLDAFLEQILPLNDDIWYWDEVLSSYSYSSLYTLQTSPTRFWTFGRDIYSDTKNRVQQVFSGEDAQLYNSISSRWGQYYGLVKDSIRDRSLANLQTRFTSPFIQARAEARSKQKSLKRLRDINACALGVLMDDGFDFPVDEFGTAAHGDLQQIVSRSIVLMDTALKLLPSAEEWSTKEFEDQVYSHIDDYVERDGVDWNQPHALAQTLLEQLSSHIPQYQRSMRRQVNNNGRPTKLVRYWLPAIVLVLSSGTILRVFFNRKAAIVKWIQDLGTTTINFWYNWVVEPIKKIIGTIRHDQGSEIALMSKGSLKGDRDSLERMVVDFAVDNASSALSTSEIETLRLKVREGDLTPVLRAYEHDLKKPLTGAIRGNLVRALLIQVQKTKVDVEVAIGGIDALLKSQELVFGFVSLTPGILVLLGLSRWIMSGLGMSKSRGRSREQMSRCVRYVQADQDHNHDILTF